MITLSKGLSASLPICRLLPAVYFTSDVTIEYALGQANEGNVSAAALFDPAKWIDNPATKLWTEQSSKMWDQGVAFWTSLASIGRIP